MVGEPTGEFLRSGQVSTWLKEDYGIPLSETRKLMETDVIKGEPLRPGGRDFYRKSQIKNVLKKKE